MIAQTRGNAGLEDGGKENENRKTERHFRDMTEKKMIYQ